MSHAVVRVVIAAPAPQVGYPCQTFAANMLVLYFVVVSHPTREINLEKKKKKNQTFPPEIHVSN